MFNLQRIAVPIYYINSSLLNLVTLLKNTYLSTRHMKWTMKCIGIGTYYKMAIINFLHSGQIIEFEWTVLKNVVIVFKDHRVLIIKMYLKKNYFYAVEFLLVLFNKLILCFFPQRS